MELLITLEGGKKVATTIGNHHILTDQPEKSGGSDSAPAPFDLFVASIGTCAGFYVQSYCQNKGIDPSGIEIKLETRHNPETKAITAFVTTLLLPPSIPEHLHQPLIRVAEQCAVKKVIMSGPEFIVTAEVRKGLAIDGDYSLEM